MRFDGECKSRLLQGIAALIMDVTGNGWRRESGGGKARDAVANALVQGTLKDGVEPAQLVVHPLGGCEISPVGARTAIAVDAEGSPAAPLSDWQHVHQFLDFTVWEPVVCYSGYTWKTRSVWLLQLDIHPLHPETLKRHFLSIATMASAPESAILATYIQQPIVALARKCGFHVEFDRLLDEVAMELGLLPPGVKGLRVAKFTHAWSLRPTARELHKAGLPYPLEDVDDFLDNLPSNFVPTPICNIVQERSPRIQPRKLAVPLGQDLDAQDVQTAPEIQEEAVQAEGIPIMTGETSEMREEKIVTKIASTGSEPPAKQLVSMVTTPEAEPVEKEQVTLPQAAEDEEKEPGTSPESHELPEKVEIESEHEVTEAARSLAEPSTVSPKPESKNGISEVASSHAGENSLEAGESSFEAGENSLEAVENSLEVVENSFEADENSFEAGENSFEAGENSFKAGENPLEAGENSVEGGENSVEAEPEPKEMALSRPGFISFSLYGAEFSCHDGVFGVVIGSHPNLGTWNPSTAVELTNSDGILSCSVEIEEDTEYKYALAKEENGERRIVAWEAGENRTLCASSKVADHARDWEWVQM